MDFLLRHAGTLRQACTDAIAALTIEPTVRISSNQITDVSTGTSQVSARLAAESEAVRTRLKDIHELVQARGEIRLAIKEANQQSVDGKPSVERLLNQKSVLDAHLALLKTTLGKFKNKPSNPYARVRGTDSETKHDPAEVTAAIQTIRNRLQIVTDGSVVDYVDVPSLSESDLTRIERDIATYKRRLSEVQDELAAANLRSNITLSDFTVGVLRKHGIIEPSEG